MPSNLTDNPRQSAASVWPGTCWVAGVWLVLAMVTAVPLLVGHLTQTAETRFVYLSDKAPDAASYLARMRLGYDGHWLYVNPYTAEGHPPNATNLVFLLMGHCCRWLGISVTAGFHLFRLLFGGAMLWAVGWLSALCLPSRQAARACLLLFAFASGVGFWVSLVMPQVQPAASFDLWVPESVGFYSFMVNPLFCAGIACTTWVTGLCFLAARDGRPAPAAVAGVVAAAMTLIHPYEGLTLLALIPVISLVTAGVARWRLAVLPGALVWAGTLPVLVYYYVVYHSGPGVEGALAANQTPTSQWWWVLSGMGVLAPLAAAGWRLRCTDPARLPAFVPWWLVTQAALLWAPVQFQRKLIQGLQVPLCLLAAVALVRGWRVLDSWGAAATRSVRRGLLAVTVGLLLVGTNAFLVARQSAVIGSGHRLFHLQSEEVAALRWLEANTHGRGIVLCSPHLGLYTPILAGNRVVVGHWAETPSFTDRAAEVTRFFAAETSDAERRQLLARDHVRYVVTGSDEGEQGNNNALACTLLTQRFRQGQAAVFEVVEW